MSYSLVVMLMVLLSAVWVFFDARKLRIQHRGTGELFDLGPVGWAIGSLLLWIVVFPAYLFKRTALAQAAQSENVAVVIAQDNGTYYKDLENLAALRDKGILTQDEFETKKTEILKLVGAQTARPNSESIATQATGGPIKAGLAILAMVGAVFAAVLYVSSQPPAEPVEGKFGEAHNFDGVELTVNLASIQWGVGSADSPQVAPEGNVYVAVSYGYRNTSERPLNAFSHPKVTLIDPKGVTYEPDVGASAIHATVSDDTEKALSDLNPGVTVKTSRVFEVSKQRFLNEPGWQLLVSMGSERMRIKLTIPKAEKTAEGASKEQTQAATSSTEQAQPSAESQGGILAKTAFGAVQKRQVENEAELLVNGQPFSPAIKGYEIEAKGVYTLSGSVAVVVYISSGGTACPGQYRILMLSASKIYSTPEFGTCADDAEVTQSGDEIRIKMPGFMGPSEEEAVREKAANTTHEYVLRGGLLYADGKKVD